VDVEEDSSVESDFLPDSDSVKETVAAVEVVDGLQVEAATVDGKLEVAAVVTVDGRLEEVAAVAAEVVGVKVHQLIVAGNQVHHQAGRDSRIVAEATVDGHQVEIVDQAPDGRQVAHLAQGGKLVVLPVVVTADGNLVDQAVVTVDGLLVDPAVVQVVDGNLVDQVAVMVDTHQTVDGK